MVERAGAMKLPFCVACLAKEDLQHHHLVTRAEGGSNDESNLITLCSGCHFKLHGRQKIGAYSASQHIREGHAKARAKGVKLGRKPKLTHHQRLEALARRDAGETLVDIARSFNVSHSTISRLET
jgi:HNH endonuclease/Helix-turn-helix domain of resolvase